MRLISIADLDQPEENYAPLIQQAQKLGEMWLDFVKQDQDKHEYTVVDHGEKNRAPGIHASEMSKCMRKMVYSITGVERRVAPESVDPNMKLRFRTGTAIHGQLQSDWRRMSEWYSKLYSQSGYALSFDSEVKISRDLQEKAKAWDISSGCDGVFTFWRYDVSTWVPYLRLGAEIKTSSDSEFTKRKKPESDHLEQTCLYMACLDLPLMWTIYYNKSNSNFTTPYAPWVFKFDKNLWERYLEVRFAKAHYHAETQTLPERTEGNHCRWCPFTHACQPAVLQRGQSSYGYYAPPVTVSGMRVGSRP